PQRLPRRWVVHGVRRVRQRSGRTSDRPGRRGTESGETDAGAGRRNQAIEGSPEGQPHAEPRKHIEPHVAPRAAGDLLRSAVRPRRDAGGHREGHGRRCPARRQRPVPERLAGRDGAWRCQWPRDSQGTARFELMIPRYTHPEMGRIWSEQRRYETWLLVETAAAEAMAAAGLVPAEAARDIRERGGFDVARIEEIEKTTQHDV